MSDLNKFQKKYDGLELIVASNAKIKVGDFVWNPRIGKTTFNHPGMLTSIYDALHDLEIIDREKRKGLEAMAETTELIEAELPDRTISFDLGVGVDLEYPTIGEIGANFEMSKSKAFKFTNVRMKRMSSDLRDELDELLEELFDNNEGRRKAIANWKDEAGKLRMTSLITELWYADMSMKFDTEYEAAVEAAAEYAGVGIKGKLNISGARHSEYVFDNAMLQACLLN